MRSPDVLPWFSGGSERFGHKGSGCSHVGKESDLQLFTGKFPYELASGMSCGVNILTPAVRGKHSLSLLKVSVRCRERWQSGERTPERDRRLFNQASVSRLISDPLLKMGRLTVRFEGILVAELLIKHEFRSVLRIPMQQISHAAGFAASGRNEFAELSRRFFFPARGSLKVNVENDVIVRHIRMN